jgi:hypothetical protein
MEHISTRDRFVELAPAASNIFSYMRSNLSLHRMPLEFVYAMIDKPSHRAVVKTSCNCGPGNCPPSVVWISALTDLDGGWAISHSVNYAE